MATWSPQVAGATVLRDTMLSIPAITAFVPLEDDASQYKIFFEHADDNIEMPYFMIQHLAGGFENHTKQTACDAHFKIFLTTGDMVVAVSAITALSALHRLAPVMTTYATGNPDGNEVLDSFSTIRETMPLFERKPVQNYVQFLGGGVYRIRLIQESL